MNSCTRALVVLGTMQDPHVERVVQGMRQHRDTTAFVLDYLDDTRFSVSVDEAGAVRIRVNDKWLPRNILVWDRAKILAGTELYIRGNDEESTGFAAQEWRALYTLMSGLHQDRTVNSLSSKRCMIKPYQQVIAASSGFQVPKTLVTNDKGSAFAFQQTSPSGVILKSLSGGKIKPAGEGEYIPYNVMTMRIDGSDLHAASEEELACCPHFFQEEVRKAHELRVLVVGEHLHAFKIDSQACRSAEVDWRKGIQMVDFAPCSLPPNVEGKIRKFMAKMGFFTGSVDLVVDPRGATWFLECNQDGAWGWLDDIVAGAITNSFVDAFSKRLGELSELTVSP